MLQRVSKAPVSSSESACSASRMLKRLTPTAASLFASLCRYRFSLSAWMEAAYCNALRLSHERAFIRMFAMDKVARKWSSAMLSNWGLSTATRKNP